jgi:hypothetical protein
MEKKILRLTLYKKWFFEILEGKKTKENREIKPYWIKRLQGKYYDEVWFKNGYAKNAPFMRVECLKITKEEKFVIHLGKILQVKNV